MKNKIVFQVKKEDLPPPPPPPVNPLSYINKFGNKMHYYIDDVKVTAEKAKEFIKKNDDEKIQITTINGVNSLKILSKKQSNNLVWVSDFEKKYAGNAFWKKDNLKK